MTAETLEDLDALVEEVERRGFRARYLEALADDPTEYRYLPALTKDGVPEHELPELLEKVRKVAHVRKWIDVLGVDAALEPVTGNHVAYTQPAAPHEDSRTLSVEEILATARIGIPASELPKNPYTPMDDEDRFDVMCEQVAKAHGVSLARLRRIAIQEDIDSVENLREALGEVAESMKSGS